MKPVDWCLCVMYLSLTMFFVAATILLLATALAVWRTMNTYP